MLKTTESKYVFEEEFNSIEILKKIERAGRTCYKSEEAITDDSCKRFVRMLVARGHLSVLEHVSISVRFITDRGVSHEMVRHRIASFSQESTRYCNYYSKKEMMFINPTEFFINKNQSHQVWLKAMFRAQEAYNELLELGESPQMARSVLPNSLKTEFVMTANLREWRTVLEQRTSFDAHPQMKHLMKQLLSFFQLVLPEIFENVGVK